VGDDRADVFLGKREPAGLNIGA